MALGADAVQRVHEIFDGAAFVRDLGIQLTELDQGRCVAELALEPRLLQQHGFAHAGVQATLADHAAGGAATTLLDAGERVLSIEFKINLLRPAVGEKLRARATVLRGGRTVIVAESEVFAVGAGGEKLVSKATVTLARVAAD